MHKCVQWSPIPSYLTNSGALNLGGIMTREKLLRLSRSTLPWALEHSMIRSFSAIVSIWLLTWPYPNSRVLSLEGSISWSLPWGGIWWPWSSSGGGWFSFSVWGIPWLWPEEFCPPSTTSYCTIRINSDICSFIWVNSVGLTLGVEGPLVDISLAQDLVMMGSRCGGSLHYFLSAIFRNLLILRMNGTSEKRSAFDNV